MKRFLRMALTPLLILGLASTSTPGSALGTDDLIDLAIEAVNPDLKEARPVIVCAIGGTAVDTCAKSYAAGKATQQVNDNLDDIDRIVRVYTLAKNHDMPGLVSTVGVTVACMTFGELPGASLVCNEYAAKIAAATEYAINATASVVTPAGKAAMAWIGKQAGKFGCAIGFYCAKEKDPNSYEVDMGSSGVFAIRKFDLGAIWKNDYAPRIEEGIKARIEDPQHFQAMLDPVSVSKYGKWMGERQLGAKSINALTGQLYLEEQGIGIYPTAFFPFQHELNLRYADLVNQRSAELVAPSADRFEKVSANWMSLRLAIKAEQLFDSNLQPIARHAAFKAAVAECRRNVEEPNFSLFRWSKSGARLGDQTVLEGRTPAQWVPLGQWCASTYAPALASEMKLRRQHYDLALSLGCNPLPNGAKGLSCPGFAAGSPVGPNTAMGHCQAAYKGSAKAYCQASTTNTSAFPAMPRIRIPGAIPPAANQPATQAAPAPTPSPTATPTPAPRIRTKILLPSG